MRVCILKNSVTETDSHISGERKEIDYRWLIHVENFTDLSELREFLPKAIDTVIQERLHQINKGFDVNHDLENAADDSGCLIKGAVHILQSIYSMHPDEPWPYIDGKPNPLEPMQDQLAKAAAMILAQLSLINSLKLSQLGLQDED